MSGVNQGQRPNEHVLKRDWIASSNFVNCFKCNNQHIGVGGEHLHVHTNTRTIFTLTMSTIFIHLRGKWLQSQFGFANHLALFVCFISCKKWVHVDKCLLRYVHLTCEWQGVTLLGYTKFILWIYRDRENSIVNFQTSYITKHLNNLVTIWCLVVSLNEPPNNKSERKGRRSLNSP